MVVGDLKKGLISYENNTFTDHVASAFNLSPSVLEEFLNSFFQDLPDAVFVIDKQEKIIWKNSIAEKFINLSLNKCLEIDSEVYYECQKGILCLLKDLVRDVFDHPAKYRSIEENCVINGISYTFLCDAHLIMNNNQVSGLIVIAKDITPNKLAHEETVRFALQKIVNQVASGLAHEIRNPLTAVRGFIQLIHEGLRKSTKKEYLQVALDELDRANNFIKDFLLFARPAAPNFSLVPLIQVIEDAISDVRPEADLYGVHFEYISSGNYPLMYLDKEQITHALRNILQNAVDFSNSRNVKIQVINDEKEEKINLIIKNYGCTIPRENMVRIFEPFFTTKDEAPGMGLTLAQSIIKNHGGKINLYNDLEKGVITDIELYYVSKYPNEAK